MKRHLKIANLLATMGFLALIVLFSMATGITRGERSRNQPSQQQAKAENSEHPEERGFWEWLTHDAAGFFTFALVGVGGLQAWLFVFQFRLIREGLRDGERAAKAAENAANAAEKQAIIARKALSESQRAWVKVGIPTLRENLTIGSEGAFIRINVPLENIGKSPALSVSTEAWMCFYKSGVPVSNEITAKSEAIRSKERSTPITLFPGMTERDVGVRYATNASANRAELEAGSIISESPNALNPGAAFVNILIVGCITYNIINDETPKQTRFVYRLMPINPLSFIGLQEASIPKEALSLMAFNTGNSFYAD